MKALLMVLTLTLAVPSAFADGTIFCTGLSPDDGQRHDILRIEPEDIYLLTVTGQERFLTSRKETTNEWIFGNSKYLVTLNHPRKNFTQEERATGNQKVYTDTRCRYNGEPDEGW
ncbi:MAG: hypothetical protein OM95_13100 [Bdellovibrio sp. ArHS]|uniref:hypothetical protein n=1 Tax=Bdellovibrio sp. ArHS TaxID=1569284 RepID=UPI00058242D1|nr:hypothetical protein [Bdellovibrio sp. ArHS]KHD87679.1 MAG: hypothetical protein OM95_13100 [Bdellovibrio sp. ArHS]